MLLAVPFTPYFGQVQICQDLWQNTRAVHAHGSRMTIQQSLQYQQQAVVPRCRNAKLVREMETSKANEDKHSSVEHDSIGQNAHPDVPVCTLAQQCTTWKHYPSISEHSATCAYDIKCGVSLSTTGERSEQVKIRADFAFSSHQES